LISKDIFQIVVQNTPLVSIDFIVKSQKEDKILLGKRINKPAFGYYFTLGGRIMKNESIEDAKKRIFYNELGFDLAIETKFLGIFEHFYSDSIFDDIATHYINFGYEISLNQEILTFPKEQHSSYKWFTIQELLHSDEVHKYVKDYFKNLNLIVGENK